MTMTAASVGPANAPNIEMARWEGVIEQERPDGHPREQKSHGEK